MDALAHAHPLTKTGLMPARQSLRQAEVYFLYSSIFGEKILLALGIKSLDTFVQTWGMNFPMAIFYQMFYCGPFVRWIYRHIFTEK